VLLFGCVDGLNCRCVDNYYWTMNNGGGSVTCERCPNGFVQSFDGYTCVLCDEQCRTCPTSSDSYLSELDANGQPHRDAATGNLLRRCVQCNRAASVLGGTSGCVSCKSITFAELATTNLTSSVCNVVEPSGGLLFVDAPSPQPQDPTVFSVAFGNELNLPSWYYSRHLLSVYRTCRSIGRRNATACQALGNMCVLNLYNNVGASSSTSPSPSGVDACRAFASVPKTSSAGGGGNPSIVWGDSMPWLSYFESYETYLNNYVAAGTSDLNARYLRISYDNEDKCRPRNIDFVAAEYSVSGQLLSYDTFNIGKLQLCNLLSLSSSSSSASTSTVSISPFSRTNFFHSCRVSVEALLEHGRAGPVFYDLYLKYDTRGESVFPLPVMTLNYRDPSTNIEVNRMNDGRLPMQIQRRLFLVDALSAKPEPAAIPRYVRYAKSIVVRFELIRDQTEGRILPPLVLVDYDFVSTSDVRREVEINFKIEYRMNLFAQNLAVWVTVGVLVLFTFFWSCVRTWVWNRRSGKLTVDVVTLFKFFMFFASGASNAFFLMSVGLSIYWLIFYKGQSLSYVFVPQPDQEDTFRALIVVSFVLKFLDLVHLMFVQTSYDIFFIDWERPKAELFNGERVNMITPLTRAEEKSNPTGKDSTSPSQEAALAKDLIARGDLKEQGRISCWRSLFVANEWNELQTYRKINTNVQLMALLFLLKVINLEELTTADCNTAIYRDPNDYRAPYSGILRVGMAASMYIGIG
jgi:meckelin